MRSITEYINYTINEGNDNYVEYLKKRAEIADKYGHDNGPEMDKKMDAQEQKEYDDLDRKYPDAAARFNKEQLDKQNRKLKQSGQRKLLRHDIAKRELPAEYLKELADLEDKQDHEFGSPEMNQRMEDEYNKKLIQLKKKYNLLSRY